MTCYYCEVSKRTLIEAINNHKRNCLDKVRVKEAMKTLLYLYMRATGLTKKDIISKKMLEDIFKPHIFSLVQIEQQAEELCKEVLGL